MSRPIVVLIGFVAVCLSSGAHASRSSSSEVYSWAVIGDAGVWNNLTRQVRDSIREGSVTKLILPGDNIYDPQDTYEKVWAPWRGFDFSVVALGNHHQGYQAEMDFFGMPGEFFAKTYGQHIRFIALNSDNPANVKEQKKFLESQLKKAQERYIFLVYHHPSYTVSRFHRWDQKREFQLAVRPLLKKYQSKITALLVGHDHLAALMTVHGIPMVVSGATHEVRPNPAILNYTTPEGVRVETRWMHRPYPVWVRLDVDPSTDQVWLNFVNAATRRVECSARIHRWGHEGYSFPYLIERENCQRTTLR